ncbi:MAG: hypothetical protein WCA35_15135 [Kovacikia sp.]
MGEASLWGGAKSPLPLETSVLIHLAIAIDDRITLAEVMDKGA